MNKNKLLLETCLWGIATSILYFLLYYFEETLLAWSGGGSAKRLVVCRSCNRCSCFLSSPWFIYQPFLEIAGDTGQKN